MIFIAMALPDLPSVAALAGITSIERFCYNQKTSPRTNHQCVLALIDKFCCWTQSAMMGSAGWRIDLEKECEWKTKNSISESRISRSVRKWGRWCEKEYFTYWKFLCEETFQCLQGSVYFYWKFNLLLHLGLEFNLILGPFESEDRLYWLRWPPINY